MRVITGSARGRRLETLEGVDVRPTADRVKEAVFSIIQFETEGRAFLDLFAGSGQMGIEALSRGARLACFVDSSKKAADTVERNLKTTGLSDRARVFRTDSLGFLSVNRERFDIAFLDPPYRAGLLGSALQGVAAAMNRTGVIIAEHPLDVGLSREYGEFALDREYRYGKIKISTFRHKDFVNE